jgi:NAD(P)H-binding
MNVILFGATGMVGQGVLRESLLASDVERVSSIVRSPGGQQHAKLREIVPADFYDLSSITPELSGYDACFFTLGITSAGMSEQQYSHVTYDLTLAAAQVLARLNPEMTFIYVSGAGTDSTESGRSKWARVKGKTENALLSATLQSRVYVPPRLHSAPLWDQVEDEVIPNLLQHYYANISSSESAFPETYCYHRGNGTSHAQRSSSRLPQACP